MGSPVPPPYNPWQAIQDTLKRNLAAGAGSTGGGSMRSNLDSIWYSQGGNDLILKSSNPRGPLLKVADVMWEFYGYSDAKVRSLAQKLNQAGFLPTADASRDSVWDAYRQVLMEGAGRYQADPKKAPTVEYILNYYMKNPIGDAGAAKKPSVYTQTQEQMNLTDPQQASAMISQTLKERLGRAPSAAEKQAFLAALNAAEEANPSVTTTTYRLDPTSDTYNSSAKTTGGVNPAGFLDEYGPKHNQKEYGAYQAATTYFDALMSAIGAPGG